MTSGPQGESLLASSKGLVGTLLALLRTRLQLLVTEVEEEQIRLGRILWHTVLAAFLLGFGLVFLVVFLAVVFWDTHRLLVLGGAALTFLAGGVITLATARGELHRESRLFRASLAELRRDQEALGSPDGEGPP